MDAGRAEEEGGEARGIPEGFVTRFMKVAQPERRPGAWYRQPRYGVPFESTRRSLGPDDVRAILMHQGHIAICAAENGITEELAIDIDCKDGALEDRDRRYWGVRRVLGLERVPFVHSTPSGAGLRLRYRIPPTPLTRIITGRRTGLVADVLRAAGLPVLDGSVEIFPQVGQADRLPLGCRMAVLDPETLAPFANAHIGATYDSAMLGGAIERYERWAAAPIEDLAAHLESLPGEPLPRVAAGPVALGDEEFVREGDRVRPSAATLRLLRTGLTEKSSRFQVEFRVGLAAMLAPELLAEFGLHDECDDEQVATAVARWLAARHNGLSKEWLHSTRRLPTFAAIAAWRDRYLTRSTSSGTHFVDRVRAAAARLDGSLASTLLLSDEERREVVQLIEGAGLSGSWCYRAEVWVATWRRAVKSIVRHYLQTGTPLVEVDGPEGRMVLAQIAARWMEDWPYGAGGRGGEGGRRVANYVRYRQILMDAGWMHLAEPSSTAEAYKRGMRPPDDVAREAHRYAVRTPRLDVRVRDVGVDARLLGKAIDATTPRMNGRPVTIDEAHHILWLARSGVPVGRRYGARLGARLEEIAGGLEAAIELARGQKRG